MGFETAFIQIVSAAVQRYVYAIVNDPDQNLLSGRYQKGLGGRDTVLLQALLQTGLEVFGNRGLVVES